ncbi:MAG: hypothetical protein ACK5Q5_24540 [Planctomycetaceae bacterium]
MIQPRYSIALFAFLIAGWIVPGSVSAQFVPGRGTLMTTDNFETEKWGMNYNLPKSSKEEDEQIRYPLAVSTNGRWKEGPKRGIPDVVKVIDTPAGGIAGSTKSLLIRSKDTGIPGRLSYSQKQDDLVIVSNSMGLGNSPSVVTRIYLPDWDEWENRQGVHFGMRVGLQGPIKKVPENDSRFFRRNRPTTVIEPYYPGYFFQFNPKENSKNGQDSVTLLIRANEYGQDMPGPTITQSGWYTFGMSISPDARVHYYMKPGVDDLTEADFITTTYPYAIPGTTFNTLFYNICNGDDGKTWSTPIVIDDPQVFYGQSSRPAQTAQQQTGKGR